MPNTLNKNISISYMDEINRLELPKSNFVLKKNLIEFNKICKNIDEDIGTIEKQVKKIQDNIDILKKKVRNVDSNMYKLLNERSSCEYNIAKVFDKYQTIINVKKYVKYNYPMTTWFSNYNLIIENNNQLLKRLNKRKTEMRKISTLSRTILLFEKKLKIIDTAININKLETSFPRISICNICYANNIDYCLIPCGHIICSFCYSKNKNHQSVSKCPFCREIIINKQKIFF